MNKYLLDTNVVIQAHRNKSDAINRRILNSREGEICLSTIVLHELYFGVYRSDRVHENGVEMERFTGSFTLLPYEASDARHAGDIRALLRGSGSTIGALDTLIAGQARARGLILVSGNLREFARVPGLDVVDWTL